MSQNDICMKKENNERDNNIRKFFKFLPSFNKKHFKKGKSKEKHKAFFYMKDFVCFTTSPFFTKMENEIKAAWFISPQLVHSYTDLQ